MALKSYSLSLNLSVDDFILFEYFRKKKSISWNRSEEKMDESREEIGPSASQNKISQGDPTTRLEDFVFWTIMINQGRLVFPDPW